MYCVWDPDDGIRFLFKANLENVGKILRLSQPAIKRIAQECEGVDANGRPNQCHLTRALTSPPYVVGKGKRVFVTHSTET